MKRIISLFSFILAVAFLIFLSSCDPKLYTVKFELNGGSPQIADKTFRIGDRIEEVQNPTKEGYTFDGWWVDEDFTTRFEFNQKVGKDMTIYAKWKVNSYTITFVTNGGSEIDQLKYEYNININAPEAPIKEGYIFDNWYLDANLQEPFVFDKMPARNITLYAGWIPEEYEIKFLKAKGGELFADLTQLVPNNEQLTRPVDPTRVGFTFDNWYTEDDEVYDFNRLVTRPFILYAKWNVNQYTVSYVTGEGASTIQNQTYDFNAALVRPTNPTKVGYRFVGWKLDGVNFVFDDKKMPAHDIELVAEWTPNEYTISFNKNSNKVTSGGVDPINTSYDQEVVIPDHNYVIEGYRFVGWNSKSDGTGVNYIVGETYSNLTSTHLGTCELFAIWAANQYTINFSNNNGVGEMASITVTYDESVNLPLNTFTKVGYKFNGWNLNGVIYADGSLISNLTPTNNDNLTLVATWKANTYKVVFDANGGVGTMTPQTLTYDVAANLKTNTFTKEAHTFIGWTFNGVDYNDKASVKNLTSTNNESLTFVAKWQVNQYTLTIKYYDGVTPNKVSTYNFNEAITAEDDPVVAGKVFSGWKDEQTGQPFDFAGATMPSRNLVIAATYQDEIYITFDSKGGSLVERLSGVAGSPVSAPTPPTKTGYTFVDWFLAGATDPYVFTVMPDASINLEAKWNINKYNVTYETNGGNAIPTEMLDFNSTLTQVPVRTGYTFVGWFDLTLTNEITLVPADDVTVYAKWQANTYSITFNGNGNTGGNTESHTSVSYDETITLNLNNFAKKGYKFTGWATEALGAVVYTNGASVTNLTDVDGGEVVLYAIWAPITYTVKFDGHGSTSGTMANFTATYDEVHAFPTNNYVREGHDFIGWSTTTSIDNKIDNIYNLASTQGALVTIYAIWQIQTFDIRFEFEFGREPIHFTGVTYGTQLSTLELPNLDLLGHQFIEWRENGVGVNLATVYANSNKTFVAHYVAKEYNVVFLIDGTATYQLQNVTYGTEISFNDYVDALRDDHLFINGVANPDTGETNGVYTQLQNFMTGTNQAELVATLQDPVKMARLETLTPASYPYFVALATAIATSGDIPTAANNLNNVLTSERAVIQDRYLIYANNQNKPVKDGYVFVGWVIGADTQYGNHVEGSPFYVPGESFGYSPAALIAGENAKIVAKWTSLATIKDTDIQEISGTYKITWPAAVTTGLANPGETLELKYELYNIISPTERYLIAGNILTNSYTFFETNTWSVPGTYFFKVISIATVKDSEGKVLRVYKSSFADNPFEYTLQISGANLEITGQGDYYFKGIDSNYPSGETFYFYTNLTYNFKDTESFTLVDINGNPVTEGFYNDVVVLGNSGTGTNNSFTTQGLAGEFYFVRNSAPTVVYFTRVLPYVASFHFGENLENFISNKNNSVNPVFRGISKDAEYRNQLTYKIGKKNEAMTQSSGLADYDQNGFKFDLTVRTSGGNKINPYVYNDYFEYQYFKHDGTTYQEILTGAIATEPVSSTGVWKFTGEEGRYKVRIKIKDLYVAPILRANIVPLELEFILNKGANVYTHNVLRKVFATTSLKDGINLHSNITAQISPEQRYTPEAVVAGNPFLQYAKDEALRNGSADGSVVNVGVERILLAANINKAHLSGNVYIRASLTDLQEDYHINGNLFTIDGTKLPLSSIRSIGNLSKLGDTYKIVNQQSAIFTYISTNLETKVSQSTLNISDVFIKGNTTNSKLNSSSQAELQNSIELMNRNSGGHVAIQPVLGSNVNITNTAIMNSTIALTMNQGYGKAVLKTVYTQSSWANSLYLPNGCEVQLINTLLKDSGGAAIHAEDIYSTPATPSPQKIVMDDLSEIDNFVSGEEGYFKAYAMEFTVMSMKAQMEMQVSPHGKTVIRKFTDPVTGLVTEKVNFKFLFVPLGVNAGPSGRQEAVTKLYISDSAVPWPFPYYDIYNVNQYGQSNAVILPNRELMIVRRDDIPGYGKSLLGVGIYNQTP